MMNIRQHVFKSINADIHAQFAVQDASPGVLFLDENQFIPFADLGYNDEIGYFRLSAHSDIISECDNDNPEKIHVYDDGSQGEPMFVWQDADGYLHLLGELHQLADLYQALGDALRGVIDPEPVSEFDHRWGGHWRIARAVKEAIEYGVTGDPAQIADSIRAAARRGAIRGASQVDGEWSFPKRTLRSWLIRTQNERRGRRPHSRGDHAGRNIGDPKRNT